MKPRVVISAYGADYPARAAPAAQTLAPASQTLAPDSQTLAPAAQTLAPAAQTLASAAQTLAPDSQTLAPASQTLAPAAQTLALDAQIARALAPLCARITDKSRVGVAFTSSKGDLNRLEGGFFGWQPDAPALRWALELGAQGRIAAPNAACASGAHALALGAQWIEDGHADLVLAGAIEPPQHPMVTAAYRNMGALSRGGLMRPFDARRDGFVPGAGGAFFLLENEAHARARGADVHGYLSGWSWSCDAHHITQMAPGGAAIERAIAQALARAGKPKVDYVNAHGTATRNDLIEARALYRAFWPHGRGQFDQTSDRTFIRSGGRGRGGALPGRAAKRVRAADFELGKCGRANRIGFGDGKRQTDENRDRAQPQLRLWRAHRSFGV